MTVDIGGIVLSTAEQDDWRVLNAFMRTMDRRECDVFGPGGDWGELWDVAMAIRINGELIGIMGFNKFADTTELSRMRMMLFLSTDNVWRHKIAFVKHSRKVAAWMLRNMLPPWVDVVYSLPMSEYQASIDWQVRVLGFEIFREEVPVCGVKHTMLRLRKGG